MKKPIKNKNYYFIIIIYGLLLTCFLVKFNLYGSNVDWINQHTVIPEMFRKIFYETHKLIPNFIFNLGAGQNIFNFSYYGLMSPIILISYLLPFLKMSYYIIIVSFLLYILTGVLFFKFLDNKKVSAKVNLLTTLAFITLSPLTYHFHHHIMFVWYYPFLILALIGIDKYLNNKKSGLLMVSTLIIILINYYYSVPALICIFIYGIYELLKKEDFNVKAFLRMTSRIVIPILMAAFILLPSIYAIKATGRITSATVNLSELLIFNINNAMYKSYTTGITFIFLLALFGNLISKKKNKSDIFLNLSLIIILIIPLFSYILNGFLYIRGKVFIPISILYFIAFLKFIKNVYEQNITFKQIIVITLFLIIFIIIGNFKTKLAYFSLIDTLIVMISIFYYNKYKKPEIILLPVLITLIICSFSSNTSEEYISLKEYHAFLENENTVQELLNYTNKNELYRTENISDYHNTVNKYYNENYYGTSIYSSNYNGYYHNLYNNLFGNNIVDRNAFFTTGTNNNLFYLFMGTKYLISENDVGLNYKKIASLNNLSLYESTNYYPLLYTTENIGSLEYYENLEFPYNMEYMLNYPIVNTKTNTNFTSSINKLNLNLKSEYQFNLDKETNYIYHLPEVINNKYLIIDFEMSKKESCQKVNSTSIIINGVANTLTCDNWYYDNGNNNFRYVISSNENLKDLNITLSKGTFAIKNIHVYTMDNSLPSYKSIENLKIDKINNTINGNVTLNNEAYLISSIPYEKGFTVYLDNEEISYEKVNTAFLGFKVPEGNHEIKIVYKSPYYQEGIIISVIGLIGMVGVYIVERKGVKKNGKN